MDLNGSFLQFSPWSYWKFISLVTRLSKASINAAWSAVVARAGTVLLEDFVVRAATNQAQLARVAGRDDIDQKPVLGTADMAFQVTGPAP